MFDRLNSCMHGSNDLYQIIQSLNRLLNRLKWKTNLRIELLKSKLQICLVVFGPNAPAECLLLNRRFPWLKLPKITSSLIALLLISLKDGLKGHAKQEIWRLMAGFWDCCSRFLTNWRKEKKGFESFLFAHYFWLQKWENAEFNCMYCVAWVWGKKS